ncbi:MAG TPA: tetratricopeptide repeat protein [Caulobacteraceae bacterium]
MRLHRAGRLDEAAALYRWVAEQFPNEADAFHLQGVIALSKGDANGALALFEQAARLAPKEAGYLISCANALRALGRREAVLERYDRAVALDPGSAEVHFNRSIALLDLGRTDEALDACDRVLALKADWPPAHSHRGYLLRRLKRLEEALASHDQALALDPSKYESHYNRALTLQDLKRLPEAIAGFDRAIALRPGANDPKVSRAAALLMAGDFERGWPALEARWGRPLLRATLRDLGRPPWLGGDDIAGKTILLHAEQGFGDAIHFARYATLAADRGARVILEVHPALVALMRTLKGPQAVIARGDPLPAFDLHAPLLSLPLAFGTTLQTIPAPPAYLAADPAKVAHWAERLSSKTAPRVGLVWSGNPAQDNDRNRSVALGELLAFLPDGIDYVSLQTEVRQSDSAALGLGRVRHFGKALADFTDTAALAAQMDAVLSVCTSGAHLAGALGVDTRVMLTNVGTCWRWLTAREDSPWYPSMRLYRQGPDNDWRPVFQRAALDLAALRGH